jgi:hypothetical protein
LKEICEYFEYAQGEAGRDTYKTHNTAPSSAHGKPDVFISIKDTPACNDEEWNILEVD